jgi:hypothetical protein
MGKAAAVAAAAAMVGVAAFVGLAACLPRAWAEGLALMLMGAALLAGSFFMEGERAPEAAAPEPRREGEPVVTVQRAQQA